MATRGNKGSIKLPAKPKLPQPLKKGKRYGITKGK